MLYNKRVSELRDLQRITQEAWRRRGPAVEAHVGDLAWWSREPGYRTQVWALEDDALRIAELTRRGYRRAEEPFFVHLIRHLDELPPPNLPAGYTLRTIDDATDVGRRVALHRVAFAPSTMTEDKYATLQRTWPYGSGLDLAVEAADRSFAAFCTSWLDDENGVGELEPVGTHPDHGRRGLARAVCLAAMHALREHGARQVLVYARGDEGHPAPLALYSSLGFRPVARHHRYVRNPVVRG